MLCLGFLLLKRYCQGPAEPWWPFPSLRLYQGPPLPLTSSKLQGHTEAHHPPRSTSPAPAPAASASTKLPRPPSPLASSKLQGHTEAHHPPRNTSPAPAPPPLPPPAPPLGGHWPAAPGSTVPPGAGPCSCSAAPGGLSGWASRRGQTWGGGVEEEGEVEGQVGGGGGGGWTGG
jgi:Wiskott-Aldrich syndrome protein